VVLSLDLLAGCADFPSIGIAQNRCKPRRFFGARLCAQHQPQHSGESNTLRLGLRPQPRSVLVAARPCCFVSQNCILRTVEARRKFGKVGRSADYKSAIRQSSTLRYVGSLYARVRRFCFFVATTNFAKL